MMHGNMKVKLNNPLLVQSWTITARIVRRAVCEGRIEWGYKPLARKAGRKKPFGKT